MLSLRWVQILFFLIALAVLALLVNFGYLDFIQSGILRITQPIVRVASVSTIKTRDFFVSLATIRSQVRQRRELAETVERLQAENALLADTREENIRLRQILSLKQSLQLSTIPASFVSRDPSGISGSVVIDRGSSSGISPGDAILDEAGSLLGIVSEVQTNSSKFFLITDGMVKIDAKIQNIGALGIVRGSHNLGLSLDLISQDVKLTAGDRIVTSGLTGTMPAGILLGYVGEQQSGGSELFQKATIVPAANLRSFRSVLVVTSF